MSAPKISARKVTVRKQGARGVYTKTVYKPVVNGRVVQVGLGSREEAVRWAEERIAQGKTF